MRWQWQQGNAWVTGGPRVSVMDREGFCGWLTLNCGRRGWRMVNVQCWYWHHVGIGGGGGSMFLQGTSLNKGWRPKLLHNSCWGPQGGHHLWKEGIWGLSLEAAELIMESILAGFWACNGNGSGLCLSRLTGSIPGCAVGMVSLIVDYWSCDCWGNLGLTEEKHWDLRT